MALLSDLRARVRSIVRDADARFITDDDIDAWLNEAQTDLSARLDINQTEDTGTTNGSALLALPTGTEVVRVTSFRLEDDDVEFVDADTFYAWLDSGAIPAHSIAIIFAGSVQTYPTPASGIDYVLRYTSVPPTMTSATTVSLPVYLHSRMLRFAEAQAYYKMGEVGRGRDALAQYEDGLPGAPLGADKLTPGPFTLQFEPGPFDLDSEARHI